MIIFYRSRNKEALCIIKTTSLIVFEINPNNFLEWLFLGSSITVPFVASEMLWISGIHLCLLYIYFYCRKLQITVTPTSTLTNVYDLKGHWYYITALCSGDHPTYYLSDFLPELLYATFAKWHVVGKYHLKYHRSRSSCYSQQS